MLWWLCIIVVFEAFFDDGFVLLIRGSDAGWARRRRPAYRKPFWPHVEASSGCCDTYIFLSLFSLFLLSYFLFFFLKHTWPFWCLVHCPGSIGFPFLSVTLSFDAGSRRMSPSACGSGSIVPFVAGRTCLLKLWGCLLCNTLLFAQVLRAVLCKMRLFVQLVYFNAQYSFFGWSPASGWARRRQWSK